MLKIKSNMNGDVRPALMQVLCKAIECGIKFNAVECRIGISGLYFYSDKSAYSAIIEYINNIYWVDIIEDDIVVDSFHGNSVDKVISLIIDIFY